MINNEPTCYYVINNTPLCLNINQSVTPCITLALTIITTFQLAISLTMRRYCIYKNPSLTMLHNPKILKHIQILLTILVWFLPKYSSDNTPKCVICNWFIMDELNC